MCDYVIVSMIISGGKNPEVPKVEGFAPKHRQQPTVKNIVLGQH